MNPNHHKRIYLTGFMGSGKSTIAPLLAQALEFAWVDLDVAVEEAAESQVQKIFAEQGEAVFREYERAAFRSTKEMEDVVVATGGGTLIQESLMEEAKAVGVVVYLKAPLEVIKNRIEDSGSRPLIDGNASGAFEALFETRRPVYERASFVIDVDRQLPADVVQAILSLLNEKA